MICRAVVWYQEGWQAGGTPAAADCGTGLIVVILPRGAAQTSTVHPEYLAQRAVRSWRAGAGPCFPHLGAQQLVLPRPEKAARPGCDRYAAV